MTDKHVGGKALLELDKQPHPKVRGFGELTETPELSTPPGQSTPSALGTFSAHAISSTPTTQHTQGNLSTKGSMPTQGMRAALRNRTTRSSKGAQGKLSSREAQATQSEVAPTRDFMRVPNSVIRQVLSKGVFRGKSKAIYDFLYSKTRGAVVPSLSAQVSRSEIMTGASIGSTHTLRDNLLHLRSLGLVTWDEKPGEQQGNIYFVHTPEEANLPFDKDLNPVQVSSPDHPDHPGQKLPRPPRAETALGAQGSTPDGSTISDESNTFIKYIEKTDDDEAFAGLRARLEQASRDLTGKGISAEERARWDELAELLVTELKIAGGRTTVSSVPAFLTEHLRRRLWKREKRQLDSPEAPVAPSTASRVLTNDEIAKCPDCFGTGMWYPEGYEKGVARCQHKKLLSREVNNTGATASE